MADVVELIIKLINDKAALQTLGNLQKVKDDLSKGEITLRLNTNELRRQATDLRKTLDTLTKQRNDTVFGAAGFKDAEANIQKIQGMIRDLGRQMQEAQRQGNDVSVMEAHMRGLQSQLSYWQQISYAVKNGAEGLRAYDEAIARTKEQLTEVRRNIEDNGNTLRNYSVAQKEINAAIKEEAALRKETASATNSLYKARQQELEAAKAQAQAAREGRQDTQQSMYASAQRLKALQQEAEEARKATEAYERLQQVAAAGAPGRAMQSMGNALTSVGQALQSISGIFTKNNVFDTLERYATVMSARMFTQNWGKAFERYDILSTYAQYLEMIGVSAEDADASLTKLNAGIQGIPVGLSDVAYQTRMYQMYVDDLERATNLAIGLERALVAGGANEQMRNTARYEIDRLLSAGELSTSRQYRALMQGFGVSSRYLRELMGYGDLTNAEFINALFKKRISGEELIRGIEGLADSDRLNDAIETYRTTIESGLSNIGFALTRGKANILSALNESLEVGTGRNISGWLYEIRDAINEVYASITQWVRNNPQRIASFIDSIVRVFEQLRSLDWASIAEGVVRGISSLLDVVTRVLDVLAGTKLLEPFIVFSTVWAGPIADAFLKVGGTIIVLGKAVETLSMALKAAGFGETLASLGLAAGGASGGVLALAGALGALAFAITSIPSGTKDDLLAPDFTMGDALDQIESVEQAKERLEKALKPDWTHSESWGRELEATEKAVKPYIDGLRKSITDAETELARIDSVRASQATWERFLDQNFLDDERRRKGLEAFLEVARAELAALEEDYDYVRNLKFKVTNIDHPTDEELPIRNYADSLEEGVEGAAEAVEEVNQELEKLREENQKLQENYRKTLDDLFSGFGKYEVPDPVKFGDLDKNLDAHLAAAKKYRDNVEELRKYLMGNSNAGLAAYVDAMLQSGDQAGIAALAKKLADGDTEALDALGRKYGELMSIKEFESARETIIRDLAEHGAGYVFEKLASGDLDYGNYTVPQEVIDKVIVDALAERERVRQEVEAGLRGARENSAFWSAQEDTPPERETSAYWSGQIDAQKAAENLISSYDDIKDIVDEYVSKQGPLLDGLIGIDTSNLEEQKQEIAAAAAELASAAQDGVTTAMESVGGEEGEETSLAGGFRTVQTLITQIVEEHLPLLLTAITDTTTQSQEIALTAIEAVRVAFITAIEQMIQALLRLRQTSMMVANGIVQDFQRIRQAILQAKSAVDEVKGALDALVAGSPYVVDVIINTIGEVPSIPGGGGAATGGLITGPHPAKYYAKGGFVFMKPKGTDTVPAMLTPGEYVMRKRAVDQLGVPFLRSLNRLDISAAFDNLMSRVYRPSISGMMSYNNTVNRYDNRSYSVNQNIHTNNPDYSYRIANRFAHAL